MNSSKVRQMQAWTAQSAQTPQSKKQALLEFKALSKDFLANLSKSESQWQDERSTGIRTPDSFSFSLEPPEAQRPLDSIMDTGCFNEILKVAESSRRTRKKSVSRSLSVG